MRWAYWECGRAGDKSCRFKSKQKTDDLLKYFAYGHLPPHLQAITKPFAELAHRIVGTLPANLHRKMALRKLLEAKDCAVRALREQ